MKRSFVRVLWGDFLDDTNPRLKDYESEYKFQFNPKNNILIRRFKINNDIQKCMQQKFIEPFIVYTFGEKNQKQLIEMGIKSILIHKEPYKYNPIKGLYKHKLEAHKYMMEDFDEVVFLDWDTYLDKPLPSNFWEQLNKKEIFQAALGKYKISRINHRLDKRSNHFIPMGAFVYMRDKSIPDRLIKLNEGPSSWSCEPSFARLTDEMVGGWKGIETYWELFEPEFYTTKNSVYKFLKQFSKPNVCFGNGFKEDKPS